MIDFHTHIFPPSVRQQRAKYLKRDATLNALYANPSARMASAESLIAAMDSNGVDTAVAMGLGWTDYGLAREANDYIIHAANQYPQRIIGFASVNPSWGDIAVDEAERCAAAGLRGIGELHPDTQAYDLADIHTMTPLMEAAQAHNLIVTTHSSEPVGHLYPGKGSTTPQTLFGFISNFPQATIVCAHWGGGLPFYALMPEVRDALANVYFDTAASPYLYTPQIFDVAVRLVGAHKILLGSDYALMRPSRLIAQVKASGLTETERTTILKGNAERLLG